MNFPSFLLTIYHKNNENIKFSSFLFKKQYPPSLSSLPYKNDGKFIFPLFLYIMEQK
jgi:hypothetical protein